MVVEAARDRAASLACEIAAIITERGLGGDDVDVRERLAALRRDRSHRAREARAMAQRWVQIAQTREPPLAVPTAAQASRNAHALSIPSPQVEPERGEVGALLALAYPERIAKTRGSESGAFVLANGRGARIDPASPLAREPFLAVAELTGTAASGRILLAAPMTLDAIEDRFADRIVTREETIFDAATASLRGRKSRRLGALVLTEQPMPVVPSPENAQKLAAGISGLGLDVLPWTPALRQWRDRVMFLRTNAGAQWPDLSEAALKPSAVEWLAPALADKTALAELSAEELAQALSALLPWPLRRRLEAEAPSHFEAPTGSRVPIDYAAEGGPKIAIRVQELFGLDRHPTIGGASVPVTVELLSPAQRPVQTTRDLPGFWRGSYAAVRTEMRGRYPKHPWPDDPLAAAPTRRAKPRRA
jgi:ATP-dependent helicase HrpB